MPVPVDLQSPPLPVSVIVPAYNSGSTIARAVQSVLGQLRDHRPAEIIVVDDHSDDATGERAAGLGTQVIRHERNQGAAAARNTGVAAAQQPWLALLDADDEWLDNHLATLWPLRDGHVLVSGACASFFDQDPLRTPEYVGTFEAGPTVLRSPAALIPQNIVVNSGTIVQRDVVRGVGAYSTTLRYAEDWDLWLRVLERGTALLTPEVVALYHRHDSQKSWQPRGPAEAHRRILEGCAGRAWWSPALLSRWEALQRWDAMTNALRARRLGEGARLAAQLIRDPASLREVGARRERARAWDSHTQRLRRADLDGGPSSLNDALAAHRASASTHSRPT